MVFRCFFCFFFFFNDTATTEIYTLSLHDALPISPTYHCVHCRVDAERGVLRWKDRKSTRLNSSHITISYAVFCLKKKKTKQKQKIKKKTRKKNPNHKNIKEQ